MWWWLARSSWANTDLIPSSVESWTLTGAVAAMVVAVALALHRGWIKIDPKPVPPQIPLRREEDQVLIALRHDILVEVQKRLDAKETELRTAIEDARRDGITGRRAIHKKLDSMAATQEQLLREAVASAHRAENASAKIAGQVEAMVELGRPRGTS